MLIGRRQVCVGLKTKDHAGPSLPLCERSCVDLKQAGADAIDTAAKNVAIVINKRRVRARFEANTESFTGAQVDASAE